MPTVRTTPNGRIYTRPESSILWVQYKGADGRKIRKSAGTDDVDQAEAFLNQEVARLTELTFRQVVVDFFAVKERTLKPATILGYKQNLRMVDKFFGRKYLSEINRESLKSYVAVRRQEVSDTTVRRELAFLSTVMSHAVDSLPNGPEHNPVLLFSKKSMKEKVRTRWLTLDEYKRLLNACWDPMHRDIITVACHTGMRHGELLALRKHMIDLDNRKVNLRDTQTKNSNPRVVPLTGPALDTVSRLCLESPDDLIFWHRNTRKDSLGLPAPYTSFRGFFDKARVRANLNDVRFHDLRHTFASWWVQRGGGLYELKEVLGHSTLDMVQRYAHLDTASAQRVAQDVFGGHSLDTTEDLPGHSED